jgi:hypothetical protein
VAVLELGFFSAADAFVSIGLLVTLLVPACASALPARLRWMAEALESPSVRPAAEATLPPVDLAVIVLPFMPEIALKVNKFD